MHEKTTKWEWEIKQKIPVFFLPAWLTVFVYSDYVQYVHFLSINLSVCLPWVVGFSLRLYVPHSVSVSLRVDFCCLWCLGEEIQWSACRQWNRECRTFLRAPNHLSQSLYGFTEGLAVTLRGRRENVSGWCERYAVVMKENEVYRCWCQCTAGWLQGICLCCSLPSIQHQIDQL